MKKYLWIMAVCFLLAVAIDLSSSMPELGYASGSGGMQEYQTDRNDMDMDYMYEYLEPYGDWVEMEPYGYVWTPRNMGYRWRPYSDGRWISTDYGWTWVAQERWGAIPFHYGRWGYRNDFGWYWVPGTVWGPAWVSWRWSSQYVGWAPLPPGTEFRAGIGFISLSIKIPNRYWVFLQGSHFMDNDIYRSTLPYERNVTIINFTSIHHNIRFNNDRIYNEGIDMDYVRRVTRRTVTRYNVRDVQDPRLSRISGNAIHVYRHNFRQNNTAKPRAFMNKDDARRKLSSIKVFEPRLQPTLNAQRISIQRRQTREKALLRTTQEQERRHVLEKRNNQLKQINDRAEKERIVQDNQRRINNLRKQHQDETQRLNKRVRQDNEQVKRVTQQRNQELQQSRKNKNQNKNENKNKNKKK